MGGLWDSALDEYGVKLTDVIQFLANSRRAVVIIDGCRDSKANTCGQQVYVDDVGTAIVAFSCGYGGLALDRYSDGKGYAYHILEVRSLLVSACSQSISCPFANRLRL